MHTDSDNWLPADWPAPAHVHAGTTTRKGGFSRNAYASFNLSERVGDDEHVVLRNRSLLRHELDLPAEPCWLQQVHGASVINIGAGNTPRPADGSYCDRAGQVCAILTADCLPLLLCNRSGTEIAAVHIGWRGLCANIVAHAVEKFTSHTKELLVWLGPAICARHYETGDEVRSACIELIENAASAFEPTRPGHWLTSLQQLAGLQLQQLGVENIYGGNHCTFSHPDCFYSYRRDGITGRCASLIWMDCLKS